LARFLVPFFRAEKRNCPRGMSANHKPQKSSGYQKLYYKSCFLYLKISAAWVFRLCGGQFLFSARKKGTKKRAKGEGGQFTCTQVSAFPLGSPLHTAGVGA
jgi:hypothetical protein